MNDSAPSAAGGSDQPSEQPRVRCPTCGEYAPWKDNHQRPFCSRTCRLIDLGVWLEEGHVVRNETSDDVQ